MGFCFFVLVHVTKSKLNKNVFASESIPRQVHADLFRRELFTANCQLQPVHGREARPPRSRWTAADGGDGEKTRISDVARAPHVAFPSHESPLKRSRSPVFFLQTASRCPPLLLHKPKSNRCAARFCRFRTDTTAANLPRSPAVPANLRGLTVSTLPSTAAASVCTGGGCSPLAPSDAIFVL